MSSALSSYCEVDAEALLDLVEARAGIGHEGAVVLRDDHQRGGVVMLVLDVADHHLDQILDRDEAVGAAIFVDDERHVGAGRLHADQQVEGRHRARHEQDRAAGSRPRPAVIERSTWPRLGRRGRPLPLPCAAAPLPGSACCGDEIEKVADVDHAAAGRPGSRHRPGGANGRRCGTGASRSPRVVSAETATMSARGTMTSSTRMRWKPSTFFSIARSWGEKSGSSHGLREGVLEIVADRIAGLQAEAGQNPVVPVIAQRLRTPEASGAGGRCDFDLRS